MALDHEKRLKFIHIPKTGGTAVLNAMQLDPTGYHDAWNAYPASTFSYITFAVIRDPVSRFLSQYNFGMSDKSYWHVKGSQNEFCDYQEMKHMSIDEILDDLATPWQTRRLKHPGWWPQAWFICDREDRIRAHFLLRQEDLQNDLNRMLGELGHHQVTLPQVNRSERRLEMEALLDRPERLERLAEIYQKDYQAFGYSLITA